MKRAYMFFSLLLVMLISCGREEPVEGGLSIACLNESETALLYRSISFEASGRDQLIQAVLNELAATPQDPAMHALLKEGAAVESFAMEGEQLVLSMEPGYKELPPAVEILCRAGLVQSLSQLAGVDGVLLKLGGESFVDSAGNTVGVLNTESFVGTGADDAENAAALSLTLYFANESGDKLIACRRSLPYDGSTEPERLVLEQLIAGPYEPGLYPSVPDGTRILSISLSDGICYVNLDSGFTEATGDITPQVSIYAIVNSLSELGSVRRVQFLINGESNVTYREVMDLKESYLRNLEIVE